MNNARALIYVVDDDISVRERAGKFVAVGGIYGTDFFVGAGVSGQRSGRMCRVVWCWMCSSLG